MIISSDNDFVAYSSARVNKDESVQHGCFGRLQSACLDYYASVGGAPKAYGSRHVCVCLSFLVVLCYG